MIGELTFNFTGYIRNIDLRTVMDLETGGEINVDNVSAEEVMDKMNSGVWALSFRDCVAGGVVEDVEMTEIELEKNEGQK